MTDSAVRVTTKAGREGRAATPRAFRAWLVMGLVVIYMMVNWADKSAIGIAGVPIMDDLGISHSEFGLLGSCYYFLYAASTVVFGWIATRVRTPRLVLVLAAVWCLCQLPVALVPSFGVLFISRLALGASEAPATPMSNYLAHSWFPDNRRTVPSMLVMAGSSLGVLLAGPGLHSIMNRFGWHALFASLAIIGACWCVLWFLLGGEGPFSLRDRAMGQVGTPRTSEGEAAAATSPWSGVTLHKIGRLVTNPSIVAGTVAGFAGYWGISLSSTWLPAYFTEGLGYDDHDSNRLVSIWPVMSLAAMAAFTLLNVWLTRRGVSTRWSRGALLGGILTLGGGLMVVGLVLHAPAGSAVLVATGLACILPVHAFLFMIVSEVSTGAERPFSLSVSAAFTTLAGVIAPSVTGHMVDNGGFKDGYGGPFLLCAVLMIVTGIVALFVVNPNRDRFRFHSPGEAG